MATPSISRGFINRAGSEQEKEKDRLDRQLDDVKKGLLDFSKRFSKSIEATRKIVDNLDDNKTRKQLQEVLAKTESLKSVEKKLKQKGSTVSSKEAKAFLETARSLNDIVQNNQSVVKALKDQKVNLETLDIEKPLRSASKKIGEDVSEFFVSNAERISQSGIAGDIGQTAISAVSPEVGAITEALGFDIQGTFSKFFSGSQDSEEETQSEFQVVSDSVENLEDITQDEQEKTRQTIVDSQKEATKEIREGLKEVASKEQTNTNEIVDSQQFQREEQIIVMADQHKETLEELDDIEDASGGRGGLSDFMGKGKGKKTKGLLKLLAPLLLIGGLGVLIAKSLSKEDSEKIKKGITDIGDFFKDNIGRSIKMIGPIISDLVTDLATFLEDPIGNTIQGFNKLGEFISQGITSAMDNLSTSISNTTTSVRDTISQKITSTIDGIVTSIDNTTTSIRDSVSQKITTIQTTTEDTANIIRDTIVNIPTLFKNKFEEFQKDLSGDKEITKLLDKFFAPIKLIQDKITEFFGIGMEDTTEQSQLNKIGLKGIQEEDQEESFLSRARRFITLEEKGNVVKMKPQLISSSIPDIESANELESNIAQLETNKIILQASQQQTDLLQKQQKVTMTALTDKKQKGKSSIRGLTSLDNSPIMTTDVGLLVVVGGGL